MLFVSALLLMAAPPKGLELVYDIETFLRGKSTPSAMTLTGAGAFLRVDFEGMPLFFVVDGAKHELATFAPEKNVCFRLLESQAVEAQVRALQLHQKNLRKDDMLTQAQIEELVAKDAQAIEELKKPKPPRTQKVTWQKATKEFSLPCELYSVTEDGADVGQLCLQVKGKPPKSFELELKPGEWWQTLDALRVMGRLPVLLETKRDGALERRVKLRARTEKKVDPAIFMADKPCRPALEMFDKP